MSMSKRSAGVLLYRTGTDGTGVEVLLGHMGGPFWDGQEDAAWSIPKGEYEPGETPETAARREFEEEVGLPVPEGLWVPLGQSRQPSGKMVVIWAVEGEVDLAKAVYGTFAMEWPRGSGVVQEFPEIDRVAWCTPQEAASRLVTGQRVFVERLLAHLRP
ncbi:NUDIX domain-containing protein [Streptomyces sp. NBC_01218]|uniref:NUDIX domain-containing protein n=1 Tax=unclassified Streptomyces TaxID=2593676 RepID=UPI0023B91556|nr:MULTISPECIES: NUDIX domain-containing protein [unclassified Streptomyces]WEH43318.1 NUDIX domain-containing protein [Streptomyces sp. AM 2-1-1]WSQ54959.1 NUDIX domain-containing protein [Streptomyces sp. NBC_01218]